MARTSCPSDLRACSSVAGSRPVMITRAPCSTKSRAVARPMPLLPPVISAVLPESFCMGLLDGAQRLHTLEHGGNFFGIDAHIEHGRPSAAEGLVGVERLQGRGPGGHGQG